MNSFTHFPGKLFQVKIQLTLVQIFERFPFVQGSKQKNTKLFICFLFYPLYIDLYSFNLMAGWLVGCFGFNGALRQYFSPYRAVSQREGERGERIDESKNVQTTPTCTYCKRNRPLPYCNQHCWTPRHWKFTQHHRTTRPPLIQLKVNGYTFRGSNSYISFLLPISLGVNF